MHETIFIVDDEIDILNLVRITLEKEQYHIHAFTNATDFFQALTDTIPHMILLDLMLPDKNGLDICRELQNDEHYKDIPIIFLSAKSDEVDKIIGLELGADDYITKPFFPKELSTRVKVILRRYNSTHHAQSNKSFLYFESISIDQLRHEVKVDNQEIHLTATEFNLITIFVTNPGIVISRNTLLDKLWGTTKIVSDRTIDVHIRHLRTKLGAIGNRIESIHGIGYKLQ